MNKRLTAKRIRRTREHGSFSPLGQAALSSLLALEAAQRRDVRSFRAAALQNRLIPLSGVGKWIDRQREAEKSLTEWASDHGAAAVLEYPGKGVLIVKRPDIHKGGLLEQLYRISVLLAHSYGWQRAQAVAFILTGGLPEIRPIEIRLHQNFTYPRLSRIVIEADPSLGPRQILRVYREARRKLIHSRSRSIAARSAELIVFYTEHWDQGLSWREQMILWNKKYRQRPAYRFKAETNFAKQVKNSIRSLLMTDYRLWETARKKTK
jgi:hypothetical protein